MDEYIKREEIRRAYEKLTRSYVNGNPYIADWRFDEMIEKLPTIDVVPVVRCKDCNHGMRCVDGYVRCSHPSGKSILMKSSDFCSYGERKEGAE